MALLLSAAISAAAQDTAIENAISAVPRDLDQFKADQFRQYDPNRELERISRIPRLRLLAREVFGREAAGQDIRVAHQILIETYWLLNNTSDFKRVDRRLDDLDHALHSPATQSSESSAGLTVYYFQLDAAYDQLDLDKSYPFPRPLLDRINSPQKLTDYFLSVSVSNIAHQGVDHEEELNEPLADLMRLILRGLPSDYAFDPRLKQTLLDLIEQKLRDPVTGYWGERYVVGDHVQFIPDLSTTFHVISYLNGNVPDMDKVIATTLAVKDRDTPVGWLHQGQIYNHNSMDVVTLFKWGWPQASEQRRRQMAAEIQTMIQRCLSESLQPDGSFKHTSADSSVEEAEYFGESFLYRTGFFDRSQRFWTDQDFPQAAEVRQRIIGFLEKHMASGATGGVYYKSICEELGYKPEQ